MYHKHPLMSCCVLTCTEATVDLIVLACLFLVRNLSRIGVSSHCPFLVFSGVFNTGMLLAGGNLVLQLSDCMTMFTADVVYLLSRCFTSTTILKPFTSCVCSAERFLVCYNKAGDSLGTVALMQKVLDASV